MDDLMLSIVLFLPSSTQLSTQLYFWEFIYIYTHTHTEDTVAFSAKEGADPIDGARWTLCSYWEKGMRKLGRKKAEKSRAGQGDTEPAADSFSGLCLNHRRPGCASFCSSAQHHHPVSWCSRPCCQVGVSLGYTKHILCLLLFPLSSTNTYFVLIVAKHCDRCQG